ncbi:MAG: 50S ribosomal protein L28 [Planctomycetes bacterium]|nr:50S ribosomal protein L28 [Planctomycetota bacterium]
MSRVCDLCGKRAQVGVSYERRGLAKAKGGVGRRITGKTKRKFRPNIQRVRANINGTVKRIKACTQCIRSGKVVKAP